MTVAIPGNDVSLIGFEFGYRPQDNIVDDTRRHPLASRDLSVAAG
jgi:hypothetical protein